MNYKSTIFSKYLSDEEMISVVADEALIKKMLHFETALAKAQAKIGIIPKPCADEIETVLNKINISPSALTDGTFQNGIPVITLLSLIKEELTEEAQKYVHFGATSQDVMDTATVLIIKDAEAIIAGRMNSIMSKLDHLLEKYGQTPCMARTRGQLARPVTFSLKLNAWLQPLKRQLERLEMFSKNLFQLQLGGAVGDRVAYKENGNKLVNELAAELELTAATSWHTQRDNLCEFTNYLAILTGIFGKMGADILIMCQSEINEVEENAEAGGKSSTMPHKNNPVLCEALVALAKMNAGLQSQQLLGMIHTNERDATAWILEWNVIPQMLINTAVSLSHASTITSKMKVNTENMKRNVEKFLTANQANDE